MSTLRMWQGVGGSCQLISVFELQLSDLSDGWHRVPGHAEASLRLVSGDVVCDQSENGASALGLQRVLGLGSYRTAWSWLHKLRRAMIRSGRNRLAGWVEVDETYLGGPEEGAVGRGVRTRF